MISYFKTYFLQAHLFRFPFSIFHITFTMFLFTACPEPPDTPKPDKADCQKGFLPCIEDSTTCCEVECPPGTLLGGADSTECIAVECPEYYYLCGDDSTECCLETTSHAMTWEIDTIFTGFTNNAYDVAIIDDTTIWVVGEFELDDPEDTLTDFEGRFNLIKYDGKTWTLDRIMEQGWTSIARAEAIFSFSNNDVWVGNYGSPMYWDGNVWQGRASEYGWESVGGYITTIWGSGSDDVFFGSVDGQINHWDGSGFERMETPTEVQITDIYGTGPNDVWAVGYDVSTAETMLIHYNGTEWDLMYEGDIYDWFNYNEHSLSGVIKSIHAFTPGIVHVLSNSNGIYTTSVDSVPSATLQRVDPTWQGMIKMRGNHSNDLYVSGNHSGIAHYNGESVYRYTFDGELVFWDLDVKGNIVVAISKGENWVTNLAVIGHR